MKEVQVYLRNEDEAEQLRVKLNKYKASNVMIDSLEDAGNRGLNLVIPQLQDGSSGVGGGHPVNTETGAVIGVSFNDALDRDKGEERQSILSFEIDEDDLQAALIDVQEIGGLVDRALFE